MGAKSSPSGAAARRYAAAVIGLAEQAGAVAAVEKDLKEFQAMLLDSADLRLMAGSPLISRAQKQAAVLAIAAKAKFHKITADFLGVLAGNGRLGESLSIIETVGAELARRRGEITAGVQSAFPLSEAQTRSIQEIISQATGANVSLKVEINRNLIGGMVVTVGSKMIDDSVRRKLERLGRAMKSGANAA